PTPWSLSRQRAAPPARARHPARRPAAPRSRSRCGQRNRGTIRPTPNRRRPARAGRAAAGAKARPEPKLDRPGVHGLVLLQPVAVAAQHLSQRRSPIEVMPAFEVVGGLRLPYGPVAAGSTPPLDDAEQPVARHGSDAEAVETV